MRGYRPQIALGEISDVDDKGKQQTVTHHGFAGERHSEVYRPQHFGFSSRPPKGSTGVVVSLGGERNRSVFLAGEHDDHRPTGLKEGQAKLYDSAGNVIFMAGDDGLTKKVAKGDFAVSVSEKDVTIETKKGKVKVTSKGDVFIASEGKVYLGSSDGKNCYPVATSNGYTRVHGHYGEQRIRDLGLDLFGGCYNNRKMRGGSNLSMHALAIAIDHDPERNQLRWGRDRAAFAKPVYDAWWRFWADEGWVSLGRERDMDWMHIQAARL